MAKRKTELNQHVSLLEKDYLTLRALKISGIEKMPIYKGIDSIIKDGRIEVHMKSAKGKYK